ncbi:unnamed protein product [Tenebrio molitor]|nr:unnamed protein product [Tenebrio molitor]
MIYSILTVVFVQTLVDLTTAAANSHDNPCGQLYLTQSPNKSKYVQLNWNFTCDNPPDTILLTLGDPKKSENAKILYRIFPGAVSNGYHQTDYAFRDVQLPGNWTEENPNPDLEAQCFDYYIASVRNNELVYSQCLSIQPAWMSNFGELRIGDMMIPGTHNSGAWRGAPLLIRNYVLNQDRNFWEQLVYGIRYFDIRTGRYGPSPDGLYINHAFIKCTELVPELERAVNFLKKSPKEVVVLNFHQFPYPSDFLISHHLEVLDVIATIFGELIYPLPRLMHRRGPKLKEFWQSGKRVIVSYRNANVVKETSWLWPPVRRDWGNIQQLDQLERYIKTKTVAPPNGNPMSVVMAELTPNYASVLKHVTRNLKDLAVMVNRELSDWLRDNNRSDNANIIATDFFTGNDIVNVAIETNFRKLSRHLN